MPHNGAKNRFPSDSKAQIQGGKGYKQIPTGGRPEGKGPSPLNMAPGICGKPEGRAVCALRLFWLGPPGTMQQDWGRRAAASEGGSGSEAEAEWEIWG